MGREVEVGSREKSKLSGNLTGCDFCFSFSPRFVVTTEIKAASGSGGYCGVSLGNLAWMLVKLALLLGVTILSYCSSPELQNVKSLHRLNFTPRKASQLRQI